MMRGGTRTSWGTRLEEQRGTRHSILQCGGEGLTRLRARHYYAAAPAVAWKHYPQLGSVIQGFGASM